MKPFATLGSEIGKVRERVRRGAESLRPSRVALDVKDQRDRLLAKLGEQTFRLIAERKLAVPRVLQEPVERLAALLGVQLPPWPASQPPPRADGFDSASAGDGGLGAVVIDAQASASAPLAQEPVAFDPPSPEPAPAVAPIEEPAPAASLEEPVAQPAEAPAAPVAAAPVAAAPVATEPEPSPPEPVSPVAHASAPTPTEPLVEGSEPPAPPAKNTEKNAKETGAREKSSPKGGKRAKRRPTK